MLVPLCVYWTLLQPEKKHDESKEAAANLLLKEFWHARLLQCQVYLSCKYQSVHQTSVKCAFVFFFPFPHIIYLMHLV